MYTIRTKLQTVAICSYFDKIEVLSNTHTHIYICIYILIYIYIYIYSMYITCI